MDYPGALEYIASFVDYEKTRLFDYPEAFKLDRMRALAKAFGNPQNATDSVIIAGSKGKGSVAVFLSSILRMENLRVGLFTSPHLLDVRERIRVNGICISQARFTEAVLKLRGVLDEYAWRKNPPTYFEVLTVIALHHFKEMKAQVAVLEVGLGGLYDSTNIVKAKVVGITPISLEHTDKLGKTVAKIAVQKCGVIKGREIVVSAAQPAEAESIVQKAVLDQEAELYRVGREIRIVERGHDEKIQEFDVKTPFGQYYGLQTELLGFHQIENAALAVALAKGLEKKTRFQIGESAVRQGVRDAQWPGRLEKIDDRPVVVLDGAHNPDSMRRALDGLRRHYGSQTVVAVFGCSEDKDASGMLEILSRETKGIFLTKAATPRAASPRQLLQFAENAGVRAEIEEDPVNALQKAREQAGDGGLVLVAGSLFLVADILQAREKGLC